ncbi:solute carrier family 22 member 18 [Erpetoichthys calabaricus]|uniref:Organic cation transporter-like protein 2 n=1 Tax=Erpetoichthys calabaricus TaxID=27687 RepID=A0A8C4XI68_ERPCA|nr:solute carrier family 22 member 18 [Erpetoichthys calabaricus]XP_028681669.1 solute carrier family 22 member 18 [Erpetoichthys calabaricus]
MPNRVILVTYLVLTLDVTFLFVQFSITPYLAKRLGFDTVWYGYLQTSVGIIQLLGGPLFGRIADLLGARFALALSSLSMTVYYLILGSSTNALLLFLSKLPAIFMHGLPGAQMVVTDQTDPQQRADVLGKLGLFFGVGMIAGSSLGGILSTRYGESFAAFAAAAGSLLNALVVMKLIPKHTKRQTPEESSPGRGRSVFNLHEIMGLMKHPGVIKIFTIKIISGIPTGVFQVMFSIITMDFFQLTAEQTGYLLSYFGIVQMVIQGGVIGNLTSKYSEGMLLLLAVGMLSIVGLAQALMVNVFQFCVIIIPMMLSLSTFNIVTDTMLTKSVPASDTGTMLGLCASVQALVRTVGPSIGAFLYQNYGVSSIGYIQCVVSAVLFLNLLNNNIGQRKEHQ